ncbi:DddA-like double-stranded DNA deaminase toxin [Paraburkholderia kirstenboschensis]|uniref:DddA-like double-stranded DNA deaminase toxin n=1 Tax=Paraburkholderia kirstenboschensis TaxID=1245436 RepID=UPI003744A56B
MVAGAVMHTSNTMRCHGLTTDEREQLRHCREFFALPPTRSSTDTAIVGILLIPGEKPLYLKSGRHGGPCGGTHRGGIPRSAGSGNNRYSLTHVEGHAASVLHNRRIARAMLLIEMEPCGACDPNIPRMLPEGARLEVVSPNETTYYWSCQLPP